MRGESEVKKERQKCADIVTFMTTGDDDERKRMYDRIKRFASDFWPFTTQTRGELDGKLATLDWVLGGAS